MYVEARACVRDRTWAHRPRNRKRAIEGSFTKTGREIAAARKTEGKISIACEEDLFDTKLKVVGYFFCIICTILFFKNVRKRDSREIRIYIYIHISCYILIIDKESRELQNVIAPFKVDR